MFNGDLHWFYVSKPWRDLIFILKRERNYTCERCGKKFRDKDKALLIGHHTIELNETNVYDPEIALSPELIEIICHDCHNKEHRRFGHQKKVYIVWGAPLSGKTTAVRQLMSYGDIVLDIDALWEAVTFQPSYVKPNNCRFNVFDLKNKLMDQIKTRYGQWYDAYVIASLPEKYERQQLAETLGAELIYCEASKEECYSRHADSGKPEAWKQYIDNWFDQFNGE